MTYKGRLYCITCPIYKTQNLYKIGITSKVGFDEEIQKHLIQRYKTTLIDPEIMFLKIISFPQKAEKQILEELFEFRNKNTEMLTIDYDKLSIVLEKYVLHL